MDQQKFFDTYGKLPFQLASHVYGAPGLTVEGLYQAFASRFYQESVGEGSHRIDRGAQPAPVQELKEPELFAGTVPPVTLDESQPAIGIEEEPAADDTTTTKKKGKA